MRRHAFNAFALLSLVMAGALSVGYVGKIGLAIVQSVPGGAGPSSGFDIALDRGRVVCHIVDNPLSSGTMPPGRSVIRWFELFPLRAPDWRRSIWEFDAHSVSIISRPAGVRYFLLAFPIWCACVPFLIAPTIWFVKWRKRRIRQRQSTEGFAIVQRA